MVLLITPSGLCFVFFKCLLHVPRVSGKGHFSLITGNISEMFHWQIAKCKMLNTFIVSRSPVSQFKIYYFKSAFSGKSWIYFWKQKSLGRQNIEWLIWREMWLYDCSDCNDCMKGSLGSWLCDPIYVSLLSSTFNIVFRGKFWENNLFIKIKYKWFI